MENTTLLVVLGKSARPLDLEPLTESARERNLHLEVLILGVMPAMPVYYYGLSEYGAFGLPDDWQSDVDTANTELQTLRAAISDYLAEQGASCEVKVISGVADALPSLLSRAALTCDGIVLGDDLRGDVTLFGDVVRAAGIRDARVP